MRLMFAAIAVGLVRLVIPADPALLAANTALFVAGGIALIKAVAHADQ